MTRKSSLQPGSLAARSAKGERSSGDGRVMELGSDLRSLLQDLGKEQLQNGNSKSSPVSVYKEGSMSRKYRESPGSIGVPAPAMQHANIKKTLKCGPTCLSVLVKLEPRTHLQPNQIPMLSTVAISATPHAQLLG
eukprot:1142577-Pelagomonas_calceolata.AAC.3